ncbi:MAG: urease accessory protein UreE [Desulfuromonadales bacterium]|nr:urease accessory protein UreE [Desulfuromonadales bacterium]
MLLLTQKITGAKPVSLTLSLPWEKRLKSRQRVLLDSGEEAGIFLARGTILRGGDVLLAESGEAVRIAAAVERVSTVRCHDPLLLARLCYHLGNRHVALEIGENRLVYLHDHVLDEMVEQLGGEVLVEDAPFEPEHGAYREHQHGGHGQGHSHD